MISRLAWATSRDFVSKTKQGETRPDLSLTVSYAFWRCIPVLWGLFTWLRLCGRVFNTVEPGWDMKAMRWRTQSCTVHAKAQRLGKH
jgi:hypothetical protein